MRAILTLLFFIAFIQITYGQLTNRLDKLDVNDLNAKKLTVQSTTVASKPCPAMTQPQRDALTGMIEGQCVFNTTTKKLDVYNNSEWIGVGAGEGGISNWETSKIYNVGDVVIESSKIYQANIQHTSTTFASQIANWNLISGVVLDEATGALNATLIGTGTVDNTEFGRLNGVTSAIQTQIDGKQATITGAATTITSSNLTASRAVVSDGSGKVAASSVTSTELGHVSGVTSSIQTQLNGKQATITGGATTITSSNLTASRALVSDASGKVAAATATSTEVDQLSGVTSNVQTQLDSKVEGPASATNLAIARFNGTTGKLIQSGTGTITAAGTVSGLAGISSSGTATFSGVLATSGATNDATANGSQATIASTTSTVTRLTNTSLVSVGAYAATTAGRRQILINSTGAQISILNDQGATANQGILTGTGANLNLANGAAIEMIYSSALARWQVIGGSGGGGEVSDATFTGVLSLGKGGTSKSLTASNGAIAYSDADSLELLAPGTSGQILQSNGAAAPSFVNKSITGKGQYQSAVTAEQIHAPNAQLTPVATNQQLIETGNTNILVNAGFEHSTVTSSWTSSAGTTSANTASEISGLKALQIVLSAQTLNVRQDATTYATQFADGVQGIAAAWVKTSVQGVKLCPRNNSAALTGLCVSHTGSGKWERLKVPFILGGTNNGLEIRTDSAVTGTVIVDDAFVGAVDLSATQSFDTTCDTAACETEFTAKVNSTGAVYGENQDWISSNCSYSSGVANCTLVSSLFTEAPSCRATSLVSGNTATTMLNIDTSTSSISFLTRDSSSGAVINRTIHIHCSRQGSDYIAAINARKAFQKSKVSSFSSANADTDWQSCQFDSLAWQGLGTVTNNLICKRQGSDLLIGGTFTTGTVNSNTVQIPLPRWNGTQINSRSVPYYGGRILRNVAVSNSVKDYNLITTGVQSFFWVSFPEYTVSQSPLSAIAGTVGFANSQIISIEARIPIQGWENSNIIIGQFNGLESCTDTLECTDVFSAKVSAAGVVSDENIDWINGNCSGTAPIICTFRTGIFNVAPNCSVVSSDTSVTVYARMESNSPSTTQIRYYNTTPAPANVAGAVNIICQKQGADYIGKTAKAVASDQNVRSIGAVGVDIQSVYFGSGASCLNPCNTIGSCTVCTRVGSKITSVEAINTTGFYRLNGIDGTKYICNGQGLGASSSGVITHELGSSASTHAGVQAWNAGSGAAQGRASVTCIGVP